MTSEEERLISGQAWEDWCDRLKGVGRSILAEGFPDSPRERAEGFRWLNRVTQFWHDVQPEYETMHANSGFLPNECLFITLHEFLSDHWGADRSPAGAGRTTEPRGSRPNDRRGTRGA